MPTELLLLIWSTILFAAYMGAQSILYRMDLGIEYANSARDGGREPGRLAMRADRALRNFLETYPVFIALAAAALIGGRTGWLTTWGATVWFVARWVYLPLYVAGVQNIRSLIWFVSAIGLGMMFFGVAF